MLFQAKNLIYPIPATIIYILLIIVATNSKSESKNNKDTMLRVGVDNNVERLHSNRSEVIRQGIDLMNEGLGKK